MEVNSKKKSASPTSNDHKMTSRNQSHIWTSFMIEDILKWQSRHSIPLRVDTPRIHQGALITKPPTRVGT